LRPKGLITHAPAEKLKPTRFKCNLKNVAAGFSLRRHRLESLCYRVFPSGLKVFEIMWDTRPRVSGPCAAEGGGATFS
jgi:hypothetical protein